MSLRSRRIYREPRIRTQFECLCASTSKKGEATLVNISYTGALLSQPTLTPPRGDAVIVKLPLPGDRHFHLRGRVTRYDSSGFALEFDRMDDEVRRLVDDAAAIVSGVPTSRLRS
jgi:hypothetical protein